MNWKPTKSNRIERNNYEGPNRTAIHGFIGTTDMFVTCHELRGVDKAYLGPDTLDGPELQERAEKKIFEELSRLAKGFGYKLVK